ncbi:MAG TPA: LPS export ABC transporter periplasmic protein LptC, partial [Rhizomicrobium sp.]
MAPPSVGDRRDWPTRVRGTALDALRYTKFVGFMKRALPLGAFVVIGSVAVFFFLQRQPERMRMAYQRLGLIHNDFTMVKPRLTGADSKGNPFVITADSAVQEAGDTKRARLKNIEADLTVGKQGWVTVTAAHGLVDNDAGWLTLGGGIAIFSDQGYEMHTSSAEVDLGKGVMTGPAMTGHGPLGTMRADRFRMDQSSRQILL